MPWCAGEGDQCIVRVGNVDAAADKNQRALGFRQHRGGFFDVIGSGTRPAGLRFQGVWIDPEIARVEVVHCVRDILRDVEQDGTGAATGGDRVGPADMLRDAVDHFDADDLLHGGPQDF
jgi:hypothetical protein